MKSLNKSKTPIFFICSEFFVSKDNLFDVYFSDSNTDGSFYQAEHVFESLGISSDDSRKQIFRDTLREFSHFMMEMYIKCTH